MLVMIYQLCRPLKICLSVDSESITTRNELTAVLQSLSFEEIQDEERAILSCL